MSNSSSLRSPLSKARGLGSAKDGTTHWWHQRITALILAPLTIWFLYSLMDTIMKQDHKAVVEWFANPGNSIAMLVMLTALFYHAKLGLQVVVEDYVHSHYWKNTLLIGMSILFPILTAISWLSIIKLHLLGA